MTVDENHIKFTVADITALATFLAKRSSEFTDMDYVRLIFEFVSQETLPKRDLPPWE